MILKAFIWISQHGPGGADVSDGPALRFALNARPTASQGEAPATAIGNMGRGQREESSAKGRRISDSQSNLPAFKKKRLHKILDKCSRVCVSPPKKRSYMEKNICACSSTLLPSPVSNSTVSALA